MAGVKNVWDIPTSFDKSERLGTNKTPDIALVDLEDDELRPQIESLIDIAARVVGRTYTCHDLEGSGLTLDTLLLTKIGYYAFPQDFTHPLTLSHLCHRSQTEWLKAIKMIDDDQVEQVRQIGFMLVGRVRVDTMNPADVTVTCEQQQITSCKCSACTETSDVVCRHALALMIYRIKFPHKVLIHAPVTETLSSLNKDQLLQLVQRLIGDQPGGILNRIFKYKDKLESSKSNFYKSTGAPDATFGLYTKRRTAWKLSLERLSDNLKCGLINQSPCRYYGFINVHIGESINLLWETYMKIVFDLLAISNVESAVHIFVTMMETVTSIILDKESVNKYMIFASRFLYDLERQLCFFVVCYKGKWRNEILIAAATVNSKLSQCRWFNNRKKKEPSEYYDIRTIKLSRNTLRYMGIRLDHETLLSALNPNGPMYQVLLCSFLTDNLLCDIPSLLRSCDCPIEVLLLVFDMLIQWKWVFKENGDTSDYQSMVKSFGSRILEITLQYSDQLSITSCHRDSQEVDKMPEETDRGTVKDTNASPVVNMKRRLDECKASSPSKKMKPNGVQTDLSTGQVYCTLLFVSQMMINSSEATGTEFPLTPYLAKAIIRSAELERFVVRSHTDLLNFEYRSLYRIITKIIERLLTELGKEGSPLLKSVATEYGKAILCYGLEFYDGNIPLHLVDIIVRQGTLEFEEKLQFCFLLLTKSLSPLHDTVHAEINAEDYDRYGFRSKSIALETYKLLLDTLLETGPCSTYLPKVIMAMDHVSKVTDLHFLTMAFGVYEKKIELLRNTQKEKVVDLIMTYLQESSNVSQRRLRKTIDKMFIVLCKLFEDTKHHSILSIIGKWERMCQTFSRNHLKELIELLEKGASDSLVPLKELTNVMTTYLQSDVMHDITSVELVFILRNNNRARHACIDEILRNLENFSTECLLFLAQKEQEIQPPCVTRQGQLINKRVFDLVRAGLSNLTKRQKSSGMFYDIQSETRFLEFFMEVFMKNTDISSAQKEQFSSFIHLLQEKCEMETLVKLLFRLKRESVNLTRTIRTETGEKISQKLSTIFHQCLSACNHIYYSDFIIKLLNMKDIFVEFVPDGDEKYTDLVASLKKKLKSKKKLQRILNTTFQQRIV